MFKKYRNWFIAGGIFILLLAGFLYSRAKNQALAVAQYQTVVAKHGDVSAIIGATGTVRAKQSATLIWQTSGSVGAVNAQVGDTVRAGEVLAELNHATLSQSIILAQADLVSARQALDDLLNSGTTAAQAYIALKDAQESYDTALNNREALNQKTITIITEIVTPFGKFEKKKKVTPEDRKSVV